MLASITLAIAAALLATPTSGVRPGLPPFPSAASWSPLSSPHVLDMYASDLITDTETVWAALDAANDAGDFALVHRTADAALVYVAASVGESRTVARLTTALALQHGPPVPLLDDPATRPATVDELVAAAQAAAAGDAAVSSLDARTARVALRLLALSDGRAVFCAVMLQAWARAGMLIGADAAEMAATLELLRRDPAYDPAVVVWPLFQLCHLWDRLDAAPRAFEACRAANAVVHRQIHPGTNRLLVQHVRFAGSGWFEAHVPPVALPVAVAPDTGPGPVPVFIVGMPRTGSTLLEQMLSALPGVEPLGESSAVRDELLAFCDSWRDAHYPALTNEAPDYTARSFEGFTDPAVAAERAAALRARIAADAGPGARWAVLARSSDIAYAPLLARLLPDAVFIHTDRDRRDVSLSAFFALFTGWKHGNAWGFSPTDISAYYDAYLATTAALEALPNPVATVRYEELVTEPERVMRGLAQFIGGAPWSDDCLHPERLGRVPGTLSNDAVKKPISAKSVGKWRRYAGYMGEFGLDSGRGADVQQ